MQYDIIWQNIRQWERKERNKIEYYTVPKNTIIMNDINTLQ